MSHPAALSGPGATEENFFGEVQAIVQVCVCAWGVVGERERGSESGIGRALSVSSEERSGA